VAFRAIRAQDARAERDCRGRCGITHRTPTPRGRPATFARPVADLRPEYARDQYGAFVLDPDGHDVEAVRHAPER
jgi:hypothetical protein